MSRIGSNHAEATKDTMLTHDEMAYIGTLPGGVYQLSSSSLQQSNRVREDPAGLTSTRFYPRIFATKAFCNFSYTAGVRRHAELVSQKVRPTFETI